MGDTNNNLYVYKVDLTNDNVTTEASETGFDEGYTYDIFKIGSTYYVLGVEGSGVILLDYDLTVWEVNTVGNSLDEIDDLNYGFLGYSGSCGYAIVVGTDAYFLVDLMGVGLRIIKFDSVAGTLTNDEDVAGYSLNSNLNLCGIAYDDSQYLYFVVNKDADSLNYLMKYEIGGSETALSQLNVCLMLDRNNDSANDYPFDREKAFHISEDKVYQLPETYTGYLNLISSMNFSNTINGITDHFLVDNSGYWYEMGDVIVENYFSYLFLDYWKEDYPSIDMEFRSDKFQVTKGQLIQVFGYLSADDQDRLFKGTYNFGDNDVDDDQDSISFIDSYTLHDADCRIIETIDDHYKILRLQDDATGGEDPEITHNETQATSGTREFWIGVSDVTEDWQFGLVEDGVGYIVWLRITASKFQYYDSGDAWQDCGQVAVNNTLYHLKIVWYADNTFDLYINGTLLQDGVTCNNNQSSGVDEFKIECYGDSTDYIYLDGYSDPDNDTDYIVGDNQYIEEGGINQVIFEGVVDEYTGRKTQMAKVINQASEMDEIEPTGDFTGDTDGLIKDNIDNFHDYITEGTLQDGADLGTVTRAGNKKSHKYFNQCKDFDGYTFAIRPQGALDYDDGSVSTDVALLYEKGDHEDDPIWDVDTIPISSGTNQVIVKGAINPATGEPYEDQWDDESDQQLYGIHKIIIIDATLNSNAKCLTKATAIGTRESGGYLTVQCTLRKPLLGVLYPHQTIIFKYISEDISISQGIYIVDGIGVDLLTEETYLQASTGLIFEYEAFEKQLPEENAQKIEQLALDRTVNPVSEATGWVIFGNQTDYLIGYITGGVPSIKSIGNSGGFYIESDNVNSTGIVLYEDGTHYFYLYWSKAAGVGVIFGTGSVRIYANNDASNYHIFTNTAYYPSNTGLDIGQNSATTWDVIYYHTLTDKTCASFKNYSAEEIYNLLNSIQARNDGILHHDKNNKKYFPHIDMTSVPDELACYADEDYILKNLPIEKDGEIKEKEGQISFKKGDKCGINFNTMVYAMKKLLLENYEEIKELKRVKKS